MKWLRVAGLALAVLSGPSPAVAAAGVPGYEAMRASFAASDIKVLDRHGQPLEQMRADFQARRGNWVALQDVSVALQRAVILSEDQRFYEHEGVDWRALAAAAWDTVASGRPRGASTVSMQLLALVDEAYKRAPGGRSLVQKFDQALGALELEDRWTKAQILEGYLNLAAFRGELTGVDALSRVMFQKQASGLDLREAALAASMLRAPNAAQPVLVRRVCALLRELAAPEACTGLNHFVAASLRRASYPWAGVQGIAPHFARLTLESAGARPAPGEQVKTTLDASLQRFALVSVERRLHALDMANVQDAAVVVLDNATGDVLAYVGSSGSLSQAGAVDHARALRQAGSALKPFLYAQAIGEQRMTAASLLHDSPLNLSTSAGLYIPRNYDERFAGWVSARTALASSLNIPAVRTLVMVTPEAFARRLSTLGLPLAERGDYYGYSLALGSADVSLLTLTNAYRALANLGQYSAPRYVPGASRDAAPRQVGTPGEAWIVGDMLADRQARARTFGLDSPLSTPFWSAVKTGTSKDMRDNWCIGWTSRYTVGVWVGNSGGASMRDVSGVSGAGPIWHDIMDHLHRDADSRQPPVPSAVTRQAIVYEAGLEPPRAEFFLGDTASARIALASHLIAGGAAALRIAQPADGAILALDPDIPASRQRLWLRASASHGGATGDPAWQVNGRPAGKGASLSWPPLRGRHRIDLLDAEGRIMDTVYIQVRALAGTENAGGIAQ